MYHVLSTIIMYYCFFHKFWRVGLFSFSPLGPGTLCGDFVKGRGNDTDFLEILCYGCEYLALEILQLGSHFFALGIIPLAQKCYIQHKTFFSGWGFADLDLNPLTRQGQIISVKATIFIPQRCL